jgi:type IV secretion system protein TrbL
MTDLNIIDQFMSAFTTYIDSGFGLLTGDVAALSSILIALDVTIAGLFWALDGEANVLAKLIKKVLFVGAFAYLINNFSSLATIIYNSFSSLGLQATGSTISAQDLLKPGELAGTGFQAAWPLLQAAGKDISFTGIFVHAIPIFVLCIAWLVVVLSFFVLAVQLFITVLEFKLTTLAGFVLVPFALWGRTAFLAERVLGNVVASGVKVMVLAVIVGIGSTFFSQFANALPGQEVTLQDAMALALASLALFGLGIFGPGIATGLVAGAPQLGAGAAIGTGASLVGGGALAIGAARAGMSTGLASVRAGASLTGGATLAYQLGQATSGKSGVAGVGAGLAGIARGAATAGRQSAGIFTQGVSAGLGARAQAGFQSAWTATGGTRSSSSNSQSSTSSPSGGPNPGGATGTGGGSSALAPAWARRLHQTQRRRAHAQMAAQAIKEGDKPGSGLTPTIRNEDD